MNIMDGHLLTYLAATGTHGGKCARIIDFCKLDMMLFYTANHFSGNKNGFI